MIEFLARIFDVSQENAQSRFEAAHLRVRPRIILERRPRVANLALPTVQTFHHMLELQTLVREIPRPIPMSTYAEQLRWVPHKNDLHRGGGSFS